MKRLAKEGERAAVVRRRTGSGIFSQSDSLRLEEASFDGEALLTWASPEQGVKPRPEGIWRCLQTIIIILAIHVYRRNMTHSVPFLVAEEKGEKKSCVLRFFLFWEKLGQRQETDQDRE